jgi:hypothetical protein
VRAPNRSPNGTRPAARITTPWNVATTAPPRTLPTTIAGAADRGDERLPQGPELQVPHDRGGRDHPGSRLVARGGRSVSGLMISTPVVCPTDPRSPPTWPSSLGTPPPAASQGPSQGPVPRITAFGNGFTAPRPATPGPCYRGRAGLYWTG